VTMVMPAIPETTASLASMASLFGSSLLQVNGGPSTSGFEDGVDDGQQFSHAGDQRDLGRFTGDFEPLAESTDGRIESHDA